MVLPQPEQARLEPVAIARVATFVSRERLSELCGPGARACTLFPSNRLTGPCGADETEWRIRPAAEMVALTVLPKPGGLQLDSARLHEEKHLGDMRDAVREYLDTIRRRPFGSLEQCRDASDREVREFRNAVLRFAKHSMNERH